VHLTYFSQLFFWKQFHTPAIGSAAWRRWFADCDDRTRNSYASVAVDRVMLLPLSVIVADGRRMPMTLDGTSP
jgi:hypothetical protein